MEKEPVTLDGIAAWFKKTIEQRLPVPPSAYLDAATKMTVLLEDLDEDIVEAEMAVNRAVRDYMLEDESAASAKIMVRATPEYGKLLRLNAKKERVMAFCQLAKKRVEVRL